MTPMPTPTSVPDNEDLRQFPRAMLSRQALVRGDYLRLKRTSAVAALALVEMQMRAEMEPGCSLADDDDELAYASGLDPDDWQEFGPLIRRHLERLESGRLVVRMFRSDTLISYGFKLARRTRTAEARAKAAAKRAAAAAAAAAAKAGKPAAAPSPPPEQPSAAAAAAPAGKAETTTSETKASVSPVASRPVPSPAHRAGSGRNGPQESDAGAREDEPVAEAEPVRWTDPEERYRQEARRVAAAHTAVEMVKASLRKAQDDLRYQPGDERLLARIEGAPARLAAAEAVLAREEAAWRVVRGFAPAVPA